MSMEDKQHSQPASISQNWMASQAAKRINKSRGFLPIFQSTEKSESVKHQYISSNSDINSNCNTIEPCQNIPNKKKPVFEEEEKNVEENTESLWRPQSAVAWIDPKDAYSGEIHEGENTSNIPPGSSGPKISDKPSLFRLDSFKKSRRRNGRKRKLAILLGMNISSHITLASEYTAGQGSEVGPEMGQGSITGIGRSGAPAKCSPSMSTSQNPHARDGSQRRRSEGETCTYTIRGNLDKVWSFHGSEFVSEEEKCPNSLVDAGTGGPNGLHYSSLDFPTGTKTRQNSFMKHQPFQHASSPGSALPSHGTSKPTSIHQVSNVESAASSRDQRWYDWPIRVLRQGQGQERSPPISSQMSDVKCVYSDTEKTTLIDGKSFASPQGEDRLFASRASKHQALVRARSSQLSHAKNKSMMVAYDLSSDDELDNVKPLEKVVMKPVARRK